MARDDHAHEGDAVPEADRLEQEEPADPEVGEERIWPASSSPELDEADLLEQAHPVGGDPDEDYPPVS